MFSKIKDTVRRWGYKLGLIKGIKKISEKKDLTISDEMYKDISIWKRLYSGYYDKWHDVEYKTIEGTKQRRMRSLNMAKVATEELATLVFNERCSINISDETLHDDIRSVLDDSGFNREFQRFLEYMFAMGGMVIKGRVEDGEIKLSYVKADSFIPTGWSNKNVDEGVFINEIIKNDKKYTHLEWHYWEKDTYIIKNELYESEKTRDELGIKVSLSTLFDDLEEETPIENLKRSLFEYIKPSTANNIDLDSPLGVSIFANALDTMHSIDIAFDSFEREFRLGKKRILVPHTAIKTIVDPETGRQNRYFDSSDEVYEAFRFDESSQDIKDLSVELRVDEHIAAINSLLNLFAMQIGFSPGSFSFDGQSMKTATEVISENSKTFRTKQSHEVLIAEGIKGLVDLIVELAILGKVFASVEDYDVRVTFDDSVAEDKMGDLQYWVQLVTSQLSTKKRAIMKVLGLTEEEAEEELIKIMEENKAVTPNDIDFFGMNRNEEA